ncbi:MAG TPA: hypothetical protein VKB65_09130 [Myxococcota bacterium]|nr:hypothetical protein [Myxococcota bacterium]
MRTLLSTILLALMLSPTLACDSHFLGGAAVGAGGAGAAYEYQNHEALEELEDDFRDGRISREEYLDRKHEIERRSAIY